MSFILDALKRSEEERRRREQPPAASLAAPGSSPPARNWLPLIGAALILNAAALTWLMWPQDPAPSATPTAATPTAATPAPEPQPAAAVLPKPPPGALAEAVGYGAGQPAAEPLRRRTEPAASAQAEPAATAARPPQPAPEARAQVAAAPLEAPLLGELPGELRQQIPDIPVNIHVYSPQPGGRFVLIDMRRYHEGDTLASGPRLEAITPQGITLSHRGTRFRILVR